MRYLVRAHVKPGREGDLLEAIKEETLGQGSVAEGEYLRNMQDARLCDDQTVRWVEVCYCPTPLQEERPYWEEYLIWSGFRTPTIAASAGTRMGANPGLAVSAIVPRGWNRN
jgi:hypothetical protein